MSFKNLKLLLLLCVSIFSVSTQGQSVWQQMNGTFTAMCTVPSNPSIVFVGDNSGLIRKSTDKCTTWKRSFRTGGYQITDIRFVSEQVGFAVSISNGLIFSTTDGGNTWSRKQIIDAAEPSNTMRFAAFKKIIPINASTVLFELEDTGAKGLSESIITRDGGVTFSIVTAPNNIFHVSGDTLIAFGYDLDMFNLKKLKIYKSVDVGMTWTKASASPVGVTSALNIYGVGYAYFFNSNEFYFTTASNSSDRTLYKSTDGGATITSANKPSGNTTRVLWLHYKDRQNGMVITNASTSSFQKTTDGGTTWTAVSGVVPMLPATYLEGDEVLGSNTNRCVRSANYGATWTSLSDNIYQVTQTNTIPSYAFLNTVTHATSYASVSALSSGTFYGKTLVRTDDEGLSWHNVTDKDNVKYERESFHFTSPDTMLFVKSTGFGAYGIYKSNDGGKNAQLTNATNMTFGGSLNAIPSFSFVKGSKTFGVSYAVLGNGNFWLTQDGGDTWTKTTGTTPYFSVVNLQVLTKDAWFLLASENNKAAVYTSTDQGATWTNITKTINISTTAETISGVGVYFVTQSIGYVFAGQGVLYKTTDGGASWTSIRNTLPQSAQYYNFTNMTFRTENEGYLYPGLTTKDNNTWALGTAGQKMQFSTDTTLGSMMDVYGNFYKYFPATNVTNEQVIASKVTSIDVTHTVTSTISVYPNPSNDLLHITTNGDATEVSFIDMLGNTHLRQEVGTHSVISIKDLPNGVYIIKAARGEELQPLKFLKN